VGFSLTGTHAIFFIASVIVAGAVSGVFMAVTIDISTSLSDRGNRLQEQLDTEFKIISDSSNIPISGSDYIFYLKNTGGKVLVTTNETFQIFILRWAFSYMRSRSSLRFFSSASFNMGSIA